MNASATSPRRADVSSSHRERVVDAERQRALTPDRPPALRRAAWMTVRFLTRLLYRIRVQGRQHLPRTGGALLVCNRLTKADAWLLSAASGRFVRFLMHPGPDNQLFRAPLARLLGIIPIAAEQWPRDWLESLRVAREAIRQGEVVCLFAEGELTRIGQMLPFRREAERIMKDVDTPVIPVSVERGGADETARAFTVNFGPAMSPGATTFELRQAVQELASEAWQSRRAEMIPLHRAFVQTARRHPFRFAMGDARAPRVNFLTALARSIYLAHRLARGWVDQEHVGILLPPSVAGALVNFAALLMGKVPVNLNYTASEETIASCLRQCSIRTVVSSQAFLDKVPLKVPGRMILLEEIAANPRRSERLGALARALFLPVRRLERALGRPRDATMDDPATVIFSSGSTGEPKGVVLSHFNVTANIAQMDRVFGLTGRDCFLGTLPFFHSFGFTGTLCLTGTLGVGVAYHPTPLDAAVVGRLVSTYSITFLLSTPTFLQLYLRGCAAADFGSLRVVMAGAEKLTERLAAAFEEKFCIRPLEGYGCTECSPVVAVNTHDFRAPGIRQLGGRRGKIGRPLPGVSTRIVDRETCRPLPVGQAGLLLVRGPNVMQGYLHDPKKTAEVLRDGWYCTGDIATLDEEGFLQITDRVSRFSKIGGEMVPHLKVEERLHELTGAMERTFVVAGVPDSKKGERLVVLHTLPDEALRACLDRFASDELPNLWKPRSDAFFRIETFPQLGTGKLDLRRIQELALEFSGRGDRAGIVEPSQIKRGDNAETRAAS